MTETFTPSELATIRADLADCEREAAINEAARKVVDAAVAVEIAGSARIRVGMLQGSGLAKLEAVRLLFDAQLQAMSVQADALGEYRALTEAPRPASNQSAIDHALERLTDEGKLEEMAKATE